MPGGPADSASSHFVKQANIRAGGEDTFSLAQFQHFRLHVWLYLHIDCGVRVRSTFQHTAALPAPPLGGVLGGAAFSLVFCCGCCLASFGRCSGWGSFSLSSVGRLLLLSRNVIGVSFTYERPGVRALFVFPSHVLW